MKYSPPGAYSVSIHEEAQHDLDQLFRTDSRAASAIFAFIGEVSKSQDLLDRFTSADFRNFDAPEFDVKRWGTQWRDHALWRAKMLNTPSRAHKYRIIYTFHPAEKRYYILAIAPRAFEYGKHHPLTQRIIRAYTELGIP